MSPLIPELFILVVYFFPYLCHGKYFTIIILHCSSKHTCLSYCGVSVAFLITLDWESRDISFAVFKANGSFNFALKTMRCNNSYFANPALTYALSASECMDYIQANRPKTSLVHWY